MTLFDHSESRLADVLRFQAGIHGIKLNDHVPAQTKEDRPKTSFMFGDPDDYREMSREERQALTDKMMNQHQIWVMEKKPLGGKRARMG